MDFKMKFVSRYSSFILYVVVMLFIALIDVVVGIHINLWLLYGIPVGLATWNLGRAPGFVLAAIGVVLLLATAAICGHPYASLAYLAMSYFSKALAYFVLVGLVSALRKKEVERVFTPPKFRG